MTCERRILGRYLSNIPTLGLLDRSVLQHINTGNGKGPCLSDTQHEKLALALAQWLAAQSRLTARSSLVSNPQRQTFVCYPRFRVGYFPGALVSPHTMHVELIVLPLPLTKSPVIGLGLDPAPSGDGIILIVMVKCS